MLCEHFCNSPTRVLSQVMKVWLKARMELVCTVLMYHSVKKSHEHMLWCSNTRADGAVGAYSPSNHLIPVDNNLIPVDNNFMHYVL